MNSDRGSTDLDGRLRAAFRARAGDGRLPEGFLARLKSDLPPRQGLPPRSGWRLSRSGTGPTLESPAGLVAVLTACLAVVIAVVLVVTAARPDLLAGLPPGRSVPPSVVMSPVSPSSLRPAPSSTSAPEGASKARYDDGIPRAFDGRPVLRGAAAEAHAKAAPDDTAFLIGGWVDMSPPGVALSCPLIVHPTWLNDCGAPVLRDVAGEADSVLTVPVTFHFLFEKGGTGSPITQGPAIVRVHVHDPRAGQCGAQASACAAAMVVDGVLWNGDGVTDPGPLTLDAVRSIVAAFQPDAPLAAVRSGTICSSLPSAAFYAAGDEPSRVPAIIGVAIEPSVGARDRALDQMTGAATALASGWWPHGPICGQTGTGRGDSETWVSWRNLAIANVVVNVQTALTPTVADRSFVERLAAALEGAAATGP